MDAEIIRDRRRQFEPFGIYISVNDVDDLMTLWWRLKIGEAAVREIANRYPDDVRAAREVPVDQDLICHNPQQLLDREVTKVFGQV